MVNELVVTFFTPVVTVPQSHVDSVEHQVGFLAGPGKMADRGLLDPS
jgi:hypothetical protein